MNEIWLDVFGYEGLYRVSNLGRVKSLGNNKHKVDKILKLKNETSGYLKVGLSKNGKVRNVKVHRLVALAFMLTSDTSKQINHIDGDKWNNKPENLTWCTQKENNNHALSTGLSKPIPKPPVKLTDEQVNEIRLLLLNGELNYREIGERYNVSRTMIYYISNDKSRFGGVSV